MLTRTRGQNHGLDLQGQDQGAKAQSQGLVLKDNQGPRTTHCHKARLFKTWLGIAINVVHAIEGLVNSALPAATSPINSCHSSFQANFLSSCSKVFMSCILFDFRSLIPWQWNAAILIWRSRNYNATTIADCDNEGVKPVTNVLLLYNNRYTI